MGYHQQQGGGWSGDLLLIDQEKLNDAEHVSDVYVKRLKAPEVFPTLINGSDVFPLVEGSIAQPGPKPKGIRRRPPPRLAASDGLQQEGNEP